MESYMHGIDDENYLVFYIRILKRIEYRSFIINYEL